jgi:hypothetical protein
MGGTSGKLICWRFVACGVSTAVPGVCILWGVCAGCGGESVGLRVAGRLFGTLLGPEATGHVCVVCVSGFPWLVLSCHRLVVGWGVVGLLFENYIVDASIL